MLHETRYDEVLDTQRHFRALLDSMSRPGKINRLDELKLSPPAGLSRGAACVALVLMNADVRFHASGLGERAGEYINVNTRSLFVDAEQADFLFLDGAGSPLLVQAAPCGTLPYPDSGATVVIQVGALAADPIAGATRLTLSGPGVEEKKDLYVAGLDPPLLAALRDKNAEFPLGVDTILTADSGASEAWIAAVPRSARMEWQSC